MLGAPRTKLAPRSAADGVLKNEARWLRTQLARLPAATLSPLLSIGSGEEAVRTDGHPWIADHVFSPLAARGIEVIHHEHAPGPGIDVVGDLLEESTLMSLAATGARSVLCCNVLEHIERRGHVTAALAGLVAPGGYLVITVPYRFPYHPDPIDTMFRPSVAELRAEFAPLRFRTGAVVPCGTLWRYLLDVPDARASALAGLRVALRGVLGRTRATPEAKARPAGAGALRYLVRQTAVACAVFERTAP